MDETKSLSEKRIKPKVGPLGGNALISRRATTWSPHLCLRHAEIVAENTLLRLSQETSSCSQETSSQETSSCSSHHRQQQVVVSQHECVDVLCKGRAGTWDPDGKSANSIIHKGLPFPFFLCYKAQPVPSPLSPLSTVKLSARHRFATFLTGRRWISTFGRKCRCVSQMFTAPPPSTAAAGVVRVE